LLIGDLQETEGSIMGESSVVGGDMLGDRIVFVFVHFRHRSMIID
jgi:hypothetical protein